MLSLLTPILRRYDDMNSIITVFEDKKFNRYSSFDNYLDNEQVKKISHWFCKFSKKQINMEQVIELMYDLYLRDNIDYYDAKEYTEVVGFLSEKYGFSRSDFLDLYKQFRKLVFNS